VEPAGTIRMGSRRTDQAGRSELGGLRILVANEDPQRLDAVVGVAEGLGQVVVAREVDVGSVADRARELGPDVAIVGLHDHNTEHALALISEIVGEGICPVVAITEGSDPEFVASAAQSGIFAFVTTLDGDSLRGAFDIALRRFGQTEQLEGALARRAVIERAKGILMERYGIDERAAFERLRAQSQGTGEKLVTICQAMLHSHTLLYEKPGESPGP
jgi:AmiR/NasT family two-component response regulator